MKKRRPIEYLLLSCALLSIILLFAIAISLFKEGLPIFKVVNPVKFIFGSHWYPAHDPPEFGTLPLILASLLIAIGALIVAVPLGIGSAIYMTELAHPKIKEIIKPILELLASIPSIIYGFFGMVIFAPFVQKIFNIPTGLTALTASILLGIMAVPTITSIAEDSITSIPNNIREASHALGATKWETIIQAVIPAARSGILTAIILGMSRAIGETMTVLMIAGGAAVIPKSFLQPVRPMTATIAAEMGEAPMGSLHFHALFAIAAILFLITLGFNILANHIKEKRI
ncbi:MAG: phosphate ABC transporter permease subunit PstC [Caldisericaceae bacterium]|nr:phosphate ABC transporter permease subunit PstC [Caldisericaceae bacterium]